MIIHSPHCKLYKRTRHNFQIWEMEDGEQYLDRADEDDTEEFSPDCKFVRQFKATDFLTAEQIAFGKLPPLDSGIAELVFTVNDVPGIITEFSCMGHPEEEDTEGYILFVVNKLANLKRFVKILRLLVGPGDEDFESPIDIRLEYCLSSPDVTEHELRMNMQMTDSKKGGPPSADAYDWLAQGIRQQLADMGFACPAACSRRASSEPAEALPTPTVRPRR